VYDFRDCSPVEVNKSHHSLQTSATKTQALVNFIFFHGLMGSLYLRRMERVNIKRLRGRAKLVGTIVSVGGVMLMTLYKGPLVKMVWSANHQSPEDNQKSTQAATASGNKDWIVGSVLIVAATLAWSLLFILQVIIYF
jgi:hypothetical protein